MASGRYCGNCGAAIDPRTRYCGHCGARTGAPASPGQPPLGNPAQTVTPGAPPLAPAHASMPPVTGAIPVMPPGVAPAGGLSSSVVGRGRYVIDHLLGRGGMSAVYAARDLHISGRLVAVKEMVDQFADPQERLEAERDFLREADMLATLRHPAIPAIIDRFSENSRHLLVMEYIAGENLESTLAAHGPFEEEQVRRWALELCSVLDYLHRREPPVVFRDLKPGNIIVQPDGRVRLIDFGIARLFKPQQKADTTALGTSGYASPEHYTGQTDARSDIYSLGATMHHLLTGRDPSKFPPFQFPSVRELNPAVSNDLTALIERSVRTDRDRRFASVDELREALERKRKKQSKAAVSAPAPVPTPAPRPVQNSVPPAAPASRPIQSSAPPPRVTPAVAAPAATAASPVSPPSLRLPAPVASRPVLVLDSFVPGRRIDHAAVAAQVAAMTGGTTAALRLVLQRGLPATLPMPSGAGAASGVQALAALNVKARVVTPGMVPVLLSEELRRRLDTTHQLVVRDVIVGPARTCRCRRCSYVWQTHKAAGEPVPLRCPNCRSLEWGRWRIFKCAWCGHEFDNADVNTKRTDRLYPACPCCGLVNWETGRPPSRTGWLDRLLAALAGTA